MTNFKKILSLALSIITLLPFSQIEAMKPAAKRQKIQIPSKESTLSLDEAEQEVHILGEKFNRLINDNFFKKISPSDDIPDDIIRDPNKQLTGFLDSKTQKWVYESLIPEFKDITSKFRSIIDSLPDISYNYDVESRMWEATYMIPKFDSEWASTYTFKDKLACYLALVFFHKALWDVAGFTLTFPLIDVSDTFPKFLTPPITTNNAMERFVYRYFNLYSTKHTCKLDTECRFSHHRFLSTLFVDCICHPIPECDNNKILALFLGLHHYVLSSKSINDGIFVISPVDFDK